MTVLSEIDAVSTEIYSPGLTQTSVLGFNAFIIIWPVKDDKTLPSSN